MSDHDEPNETAAPQQMSLNEEWLPPAPPAIPAGGPTSRLSRRMLLGVGVGVLLAGGLALGLVLGLSGSANTPQAVAGDFVNNLLAGNYTQACKDVEPSGQGECSLVFLAISGLSQGKTVMSGHASVGDAVTQGSQALVSITGRVCGLFVDSTPTTSCQSMTNASEQLPRTPAAFSAEWAQVNGNSSSFGPIPCEEIAGKWYVYLSPSGLGATGSTGSTSTVLPQDNDVAAESALQTALTGAKTYYVQNNLSYGGLNPKSFAAIDTGLRAVAGATPSTGPSVVSLQTGGAGTFAVMTAWVPSTQTCWAIMDSTARNSLDGQTAFIGTLYIKTPATQQSACAAVSYATRQLPAGSAKSLNGFGGLG
jgi:hypothetical protein